MRTQYVLPVVVLLATSFVSLGGCSSRQPGPAAAPLLPAGTASTRPADPMTGSAGISSIAATVNGRPIPMDQLVQMMILSHGVEAAEQLIATAVVDEAAAKDGVVVTDADAAAEHNETLAQLAPNMPAADQERMLDELLKRRSLARSTWDMIMRRNAILRKIAEKRINITEGMITAEYNRQYGAKAQVRHIQCASMADAMNVMDLLDKAGDFAQLASKLSINAQSAADGGSIPPFTQESPEVPPAFRKAAFALQEGQVSEVVQVGKDFHIIKLERLIPPENVTYESVRESLKKQVHDHLVKQMQAQILQDLIRVADVQFINPTLKEQARLQNPTGKIQ